MTRHHSWVAGLAFVLLLAGMPVKAQAHGRSHFSVGFSVGAPYYRPAYGGYYPYGGYYAAPYAPAFPVYLQAPLMMSPPVTIVQQPPAQAPVPVMRYYCEGEKRFYPDVETCPSGWRELPAQPADFKR